MQRADDLTRSVTDNVGYTLAGALLGAAIVAGLNRYTPLRPPWWLGIAVGAAFGSSAQWHKENMS